MQKIIICIIAGLGAGLGTGFAGMSAAAVISPMLITFLDMDPYMAVGIALAPARYRQVPLLLLHMAETKISISETVSS